MAFRKKTNKRKAGKRRVFKRKAKKTYQKTQVSTGIGFPRQIKMVHKYQQTTRLNNTSGSIAFQRFRANGMNDPDQTGSGHQPLYYDQCTPLYNHYTIIGSKIFITFVHSGTGVPTHCAVVTDDDTANSGVMTTLLEQTQNKYTAMSYGNSKPSRLTHRYSAMKTFGKSVMGNNRLQGTLGADPVEQSFFTVYTQPIDGISNNTVDIVVSIEYIAIWTEMKDIAGS